MRRTDLFVTNIQRFSLDDGPGIRTTVFLAGCNMRCLWCHNPENFECIMLAYDIQKCVGCRKCKQVCQKGVHLFKNNEHQIVWERCKRCLRCINVCENKALFQNSRDMAINDILAEIEKDKHFYRRSSGGVTFSGGEPVLYLEELERILEKCKEAGFHTAIETSGNYPFDFLERLLEYIDLVIIDCKAYSEEVHKRCTGKSNKLILSNIEELSFMDTKMWVRIPVIWGVNITLYEMQKIAEFLEGKQIEKVELIPYHKMGIAKYKIYGQKYTINDAKIPTAKQLEDCYQILKNYHIYL